MKTTIMIADVGNNGIIIIIIIIRVIRHDSVLQHLRTETDGKARCAMT